jgi:O-antigen biosynthesis protein WbqP
MYFLIKRAFDIVLAFFLLTVVSPFILPLFLFLKIRNDKGPVIYWSKRFGANEKIFLMPKIRSMKIDTPQVATHLLHSSDQYLTATGSFLRKSSLDELPQLFSIIKGEMSFVGPRPALFNQHDLMDLRKTKGIKSLRPGLTGWAQINGRDEISIKEKVDFEVYYNQHKSFFLDVKILFLTVLRVIRRDNIKH